MWSYGPDIILFMVGIGIFFIDVPHNNILGLLILAIAGIMGVVHYFRGHRFQPRKSADIAAPSTVNISPAEEIKGRLTPNLQLGAIGWGDVCLEDDVWTPDPKHGEKVPALLAEVVNAPSDSRDVGYAEYVRALLSVSWKGGSASVSPLPWIEEWYNSVNIAPGDRKVVVLAVEPFLAKWCFVVNRRSDANFVGQSAIEHSEAPRMDASLELNLIDSETGRITNKFFLEWICSPTSARPNVRRKRAAQS